MRIRILIIVFLLSFILISATGKTFSGYHTSANFVVNVGANATIIEARYDEYQKDLLMKQSDDSPGLVNMEDYASLDSLDSPAPFDPTDSSDPSDSSDSSDPSDPSDPSDSANLSDLDLADISNSAETSAVPESIAESGNEVNTDETDEDEEETFEQQSNILWDIDNISEDKIKP